MTPNMYNAYILWSEAGDTSFWKIYSYTDHQSFSCSSHPVSTITLCTQQDYFGRRCGNPLHSYCTSTYTDNNSAASLK